MDADRLRSLLEQVKSGEVAVEGALNALRSLPFEDLGFAKVDHHRALRNGFPEVIYCPGKTTEQIVAIAERLSLHSRRVLASRASQEVADAIQVRCPTAIYHPIAKMVVIHSEQNGGAEPSAQSAQSTDTQGTVLVISAGTADMPIAEEAAITASEMGSPVDRLYDVGVAGIHRLLASQERIFAANVIIVVAGMEGALASVVGGLVARPVIAVPTSVGYGASFGGVSALLTMLNSCATGVGVVNIDNGFGAGFLAHLINQPALTRASVEA